MEREIEKGSCPLQFEYLEFGEKPFQFIESEEKLDEVLSYLLRLGEYRGYTEHLVGNNVYMDLDMLCRKIQFKRTHSPVERSEIQWKIQRYKNKLKPDYAGKVCLEIVQCVFSLPEGAAEKYQIVYDGQKTYALDSFSRASSLQANSSSTFPFHSSRFFRILVQRSMSWPSSSFAS